VIIEGSGLVREAAKDKGDGAGWGDAGATRGDAREIIAALRDLSS
jgi:hypothetical protein